MHVCRMLWIHTNVRIGIVHTCGHVSLSFINPLLLLVCLCVLWLYIIVLIVLSSVRPFVWYSVRPSACLSVCMFTCTYVETNLVDIENWIDLTDTLSGLSLHWTLISFVFFFCCCFFFFFFMSRFKRRHCRYVHLFMQKLCLRSPKKYTYICER